MKLKREDAEKQFIKLTKELNADISIAKSIKQFSDYQLLKKTNALLKQARCQPMTNEELETELI